MIFDFMTNRILFAVGMIVLIVLTSILSMFEEVHIFLVILLAFTFVFIINFLMKKVATSGYRHINELLFYYGDAEGYLKHMAVLYHRGSRKRKPFMAVKTQNLIMANLFAGDLETAKKLNDDFLKKYHDELNRQASIKFSQTMIECLIHLFDYNPDALDSSYQALQDALQHYDEVTRKYMDENPYSVYYMIGKLKNLLEKEKAIDVNAFIEEFSTMNEFLKTCIIYGLLKQGRVENKSELSFARAPGNTLFYLDESVVL